MIARLRAILADEREVYAIIVEELRGAEEDLRRRAPHRDRRRDHRDLDRGHDRRRGHGGDDLPRGLHQAEPRVAVPRAAPRRQGQDRCDDARRGLRRAALRRLDAQLHPVLHHRRQGLLDEGPRGPAGRAGGARQGDRQPAHAAAGREDLRLPAGARVPGGPLRLLRDQAGRREEDRPHGVRQSPALRHHRDRPRRGRRADRRAPHRRQPGDPALHPQRQVDPLQGGGRAQHGPRRRRGEGHHARRRRRAWSASRS